MKFAFVVPPQRTPLPRTDPTLSLAALRAGAAVTLAKCDRIIARNAPWWKEIELRSEHDHRQYQVPARQRRPGVEFSHHNGRVIGIR